MKDARTSLFQTIGYEPHKGQQKIHDSVDKYRFTTAVCGRRFGKTIAAANEGIYQLLQAGDSFGAPVVYVVSDNYAHTAKIFEQITSTLYRYFGPVVENVWKKDRIIKLKTGAYLYSKSADSPASLAGDGVSFAIIDESGFVDDYAVEVLTPSLLERQGKILAIGTPDRVNWFKEQFDIGLSPRNRDYNSIQLPTSTNPFVKKSELDKERARRSEAFFAKYYLAEWTQLNDAPFANLPDPAVKPQDPVAGRRYVAGVDLADRMDYTAVVIVDVTEKPYQIVKVQKWKGIGYKATGSRLSQILKDYDATAWVDRTGVGDAAIGFIDYGKLFPVVFTQREKMLMFDNVASHIEKGELLLLDNADLYEELRALKAIPTQQGITYAAPKGRHDDVVMALFLAGKGFTSNLYIPNHRSLGGFRAAI